MKSLILAIILFSLGAFAQQVTTATPIQQTATRLDSATNCQNYSGTAQGTITITPPSGQFVYVTALDTAATAVSAPAASRVVTTTTNLGGITQTFGLTATAGIGANNDLVSSTPIRSATAGTAVTIVTNAAITNVTFDLNVCYYFAY